MAIEKTLSILKPDVVKRRVIGEIYKLIEDAGFRIVAAKKMHLSREQAEGFYGDEHRGRPYFDELVEFMSSGPVMMQVLEGEDAIIRYRDLMGATNPADAEPGTIRAQYATSIGENAVHGSDSTVSADREIAFFFEPHELVG